MSELFDLQPGRTYILESPQFLSEKAKDRLVDILRYRTKHLKCDFIILDGGMKIARDERDEEDRKEWRRAMDEWYRESEAYNNAIEEWKRDWDI